MVHAVEDDVIDSCKREKEAAVPVALDGGFGWVVVAAAFIAYFIADGWAYSFGIIYPVLIDQFEDSKGKTAIIGALLYGVPLLVSPVVCALVSVYGCKIITVIGGLITGISFILSAYANSVGFLCLSAGFLVSIGLSMTYVPTIFIVTYYFEKRRGLALALACTGSGLGAFSFPPLLQYLMTQYSWRGTLLIFGAISFNITAAGLLYRPIPVRNEMKADRMQADVQGTASAQAQVAHSLPVSPEVETSEHTNAIEASEHPTTTNIQGGSVTNTHSSNENQSSSRSRTDACNQLKSELKTITTSMLDKTLFYNYPFLIFCASNFIIYLWQGITYLYLVDQAILFNVKADKAAFLLSVIGIARTFGQIIFGFLGDHPKFNNTVLYGSAMFAAGLGTLLVPFFTTYASLCFYSSVFGFSVSVGYTLTMLVIVDVSSLQQATNAFGLCQLFQGIATLLGTPVAGWLFDVTGHYDPSFYVAGTMIAVAGVSLFPIPCIKANRRSLQNAEDTQDTSI